MNGRWGRRGGGMGWGRGGGMGWGRGGPGHGRRVRTLLDSPKTRLSASTYSNEAPCRSREEAQADAGRRIAVVDLGACARCGACLDICPENAISMDPIVTIDPRLCTGCGTCIDACPRGALSVVHREPARVSGAVG
jgi:ferredoxin